MGFVSDLLLVSALGSLGPKNNLIIQNLFKRTLLLLRLQCIKMGSEFKVEFVFKVGYGCPLSSLWHLTTLMDSDFVGHGGDSIIWVNVVITLFFM